jgi:hypothetical protein
MHINRAIILILATAAVLAVTTRPRAATQKEDQSMWTENQDRRPGPSPGPGLERGQRRGPGRGRFELTDEEINRILKELKQRSPEKAKELEQLRGKDPERFQQELRRQAREEYGRVARERWEKWLQERRAAFLEWLDKNMPDEAKELAELKERSPDHYGEKYELVWRRYGRIYDANRRNPELAKILLEDVRLQKRRDDLIARIKATKNKREQKSLNTELEEVVGLRYDLIVRRKQIAYEWLLKRLEELQNRINDSRAEILKAQDPKVKAENIKKRTQELLEEKKGFTWD